MKSSRTARLFSTVRAWRHRRGSVIVLALAVLAILAIAAVSYVSVVRIDRESSAAAQREADFEQQVDAVVSHIQSVLTADLFGNKIVTTATPRVNRRGGNIWPKMFEDGEFRDYPTVLDDWRQFNAPALLDPNNENHYLRLDPAAPRVVESVSGADDAWLAPVEPVWEPSGINATRWGQITNLRSAYTWNQRTQRWHRGDGRFVDLSQWFATPLNGRGNPGLNLFTVGPDNRPMGPEYGTDVVPGSIFTEVFGTQIASTDAGSDRQLLEPSDEAQWVDTDGDLRPDARWTQLESLGNLYGLNWVIAARIVDASAFVNVQTALEFPYAVNSTSPSQGRQTAQVVGTGETPADVDLLRLLSFDDPNIVTNQAPNVFFNPVRTDRLNVAFGDHLVQGIGAREMIQSLYDGAAPDDPNFSENPPSQFWPPNYIWSRTDPLTRLQRRAIFENATSTIGDPLLPTFIGYPRRDLIDLMGFRATNHGFVLSKVEQRFDGPEGNGYLPDPDASPRNEVGPLRSAANPSDERSFTNEQPSLERLKLDIRRLLTVVSGVGKHSPVPVLNNPNPTGPDEFDARYGTRTINLGDLRNDTVAVQAGGEAQSAFLGPSANETVQRVFGSFVWALAPLATNQPLIPDAPNDTGTPGGIAGSGFHYGGGANAPAESYQIAVGGNQPIGAWYAISRAAAMTANLIDAMDLSESPVNQREVPTIVRVFPQVLPQNLPNPIFRWEQAVGAPVYGVSLRLDHGDVTDPSGQVITLAPTSYTGQATSFIGLDRQPFLIQGHSLAAYQHPDEEGELLAATFDVVTVNPTDPATHMGSILAVEIGNPWPQSIDLRPYEIWIDNGFSGGTGQHRIALDLGDGSLISFDGGTGTAPVDTILPGQRLVIFWASDAASAPAHMQDDWQTIVDGWTTRVLADLDANAAMARIDGAAVLVDGTSVGSSPEANIFQRFGGATNVPIMLVRKSQPDATQDPPVTQEPRLLLDRLSPPAVAPAPFPVSSQTPLTVNVSGLFLPGPPPPTTSRRGFARFVIASSMQRPSETIEGFPAYVIERRAENIGVGYTGGLDATVTSNPAMRQAWVTDIINEYPVPDPAELAPLINDETMKLGQATGNLSATPLSFKLHIPNRPLRFASEMLQLTAFCTTYRHDSQLSNLSLARAHEINANDQPWMTFSEQLGLPGHLFANGMSGAASRYLGVLDPSRYILSSSGVDLGGGGVPDPLTIPLAVRVVEPFDALRTPDDLVQGRININTAPPQVLNVLPLLAPQFQVGITGGLQPTPGVNRNTGQPENRVQTMVRYRERLEGSVTFTPEVLTGLTGLRAGDPSSNSERGFVSTAELAVLHEWDGAAGARTLRPDGSQRFFATLGADSQQMTGPELELDRYTDAGLPEPGILPVPSIDGVEERLAIYRAVSNIVSTRSDVFIAWFVLRGYDPEIIESITVDAGIGDPAERVRSAMNSPDFRPSYDSRWLAVFDRSKVRLPTDRPEVLLLVELPPVRP